MAFANLVVKRLQLPFIIITYRVSFNLESNGWFTTFGKVPERLIVKLKIQ